MAVPPCKQIDVVVVHEAFAACVKDAWQYLLENAKNISQDAGIKPEDIVLGGTPIAHVPQSMFCLSILVTHAGTHQDFYIKDFRPQAFGMNQNMTDPRFAANILKRQPMHGFNQPPGFGFSSHPQFNQPVMPSIVYLFTALAPSHEPYWSSSPMCAMPGSERPLLDRHFTYKIG